MLSCGSKLYTYGGQLRAASGKTGSASRSRCMMYTQYNREKTELSRCMNRRALLLSKENGGRGCKWYRTLHACPMHVMSVAGRWQRRARPHIHARGGVACTLSQRFIATWLVSRLSALQARAVRVPGSWSRVADGARVQGDRRVGGARLRQGCFSAPD
jgi:hypothetical protein